MGEKSSHLVQFSFCKALSDTLAEQWKHFIIRWQCCMSLIPAPPHKGVAGPVEGSGTICLGEWAAILSKLFLSPLKIPTMEVKKDNFPLCQVQRKSERKFIWNSAEAKRSRTPFLKKYVLTLLFFFFFLQLLFIIINTQRHFQGYTYFTQEYCQSQFPESNCEKVYFFAWMVPEAVKLWFFLILWCQVTVSVVELHGFSKLFFLLLKWLSDVILLTQRFPPKIYLNRNYIVRT